MHHVITRASRVYVVVHEEAGVCSTLLASYSTKMLVSVEIVSGCKVLKAWGVHQVSEIVTLGDIYCGIVAGTIESGSSLQMPPELEDQPFHRTKPKWALSRLSLQHYCQGCYRVCWKICPISRRTK